MKIVFIPNCMDFDLISGNSHYLTTAQDEFGFNEENFVIGMISLVAADKIADELISTPSLVF
jgi:hypothetical protein